ncbi:hypothetical protein JMUB6875_41820 [Nocardia sp. JMUB6875]
MHMEHGIVESGTRRVVHRRLGGIEAVRGRADQQHRARNPLQDEGEVLGSGQGLRHENRMVEQFGGGIEGELGLSRIVEGDRVHRPIVGADVEAVRVRDIHCEPG